MNVIARRRNLRHGTGRDIRSWPVLLLLLVVVLVPTICVLWLMTRVIGNERAAVRQQLTDAYRVHLMNTQDRLGEHWRKKAARLDQIADGRPGSKVFAECVLEGLADSVICFDPDHKIVYPSAAVPSAAVGDDRRAAWLQASRLEHVVRDVQAAAEAYAAIANQADDAGHAEEAARAVLAEARCRGQAKETENVLRLLTETLEQDAYRTAVDPQGRLIVADARLRALELMGGDEHARFRLTAQRLQTQLADYDDPALAAGQRRFLMKRLQLIIGREDVFPTLAAEELAARFVESNRLGTRPADFVGFAALGPDSPANRASEPDVSDPASADTAVVRAGHLDGVWQLASPSGRATALFRTETVASEARAIIDRRGLPPHSTVRLLPPGEKLNRQAVFDSRPAGDCLPDWRVVLSLENAEILDATADARITAYLWTGVLVIVVVSIVALFIARAFRRQMRLARLKNDLVATVSHELKTPLASIRLLVDTLLDENKPDDGTVREYLEMVARENTRLSRLIDNFLAFSRMERNKHAFELVRTDPSDVIEAAMEAVGERFGKPDCRLEVDIAGRLPPITADADAMVTVLLNLLDNAYKYTKLDKQIALTVYAADGNVCFDVTDNGIGISRADCRRVFNRFYQANRHLTTAGGGCGLGLSIVHFIVATHGGTVHVKSRLGQGSTFTVSLPAASDQPQTD